MTYPDPRYFGDDGEAIGDRPRRRHAPEVTYANGGTAHYLATGASTGGLFGLYRWEMGAARGGPDPHFHRTITESFYVLTGTIHIFDGRTGRPAGRATSCTSRSAGCTASATSPASRPPCSS